MCIEDRAVRCTPVLAVEVVTEEAKPIESSPPAKPSYWNLIVGHANYRWFILSYIVTNCGEYVRVADQCVCCSTSFACANRSRCLLAPDGSLMWLACHYWRPMADTVTFWLQC
jgi:hypothetical protein